MFIIGKYKKNYMVTYAYIFITYLLFMPVTTNYLMGLLECKYTKYDLDKPAKAIVVLGGGLNLNAWDYGGVSVSTTELERLRHAAKLYRDTGLPILVAGGDPLKTGYSEAVYMKKILEEEFKVPVKFIEKQSRTTDENITFASDILYKNNIDAAFVVTNSWHMRRTLSITQRQNRIRYYPSAASSDVSTNKSISLSSIGSYIPSTTSFVQIRIMTHELGGWITGKVNSHGTLF